MNKLARLQEALVDVKESFNIQLDDETPLWIIHDEGDSIWLSLRIDTPYYLIVKWCNKDNDRLIYSLSYWDKHDKEIKTLFSKFIGTKLSMGRKKNKSIKVMISDFEYETKKLYTGVTFKNKSEIRSFFERVYDSYHSINCWFK